MCIRPTISQDEATRLLSQKRSLFSKKIKETRFPIKRVELIYLPFYLFDVIFKDKFGKCSVSVIVDGLLGEPSRYARENKKTGSNGDAQKCLFIIDAVDAKHIAGSYARGLVLEQGLKMKKSAEVHEVQYRKEIFYPFWIGYLQKRKAYDFRALDAVAGEVQGIKMRKVFLKAFRQLG